MLGTDTLPPQTVVPFSVPEKKKAQVLIVDDEADIRTALVRILNLEGYLAKAAGSGKMALTMLKEAAYDVLVLDLRMPRMSGMEVLKQVQQLYPDLCTIILTGEADIESAIAAAKTDAVVDFLLKPASNKEFVNAVARAVQKRTEQQRQMRVVQAAAQMLHTIHQPDNHANGSAPPATSVAPPEKLERFIQVHPLTLDRKKRLMTILDENPARMIELTKGEAAVLSTLMTHPNQVLSCRQLVEMALGYPIAESDAESVIRPYIFRLRRKLEPSPRKPCMICTVRRQGYKFVPGEA
ncbi:MAG: response regulator transcription factor [Anaerolineae bacterium]|nr:response regulator transcription factor [Anaerolineae bacterium]